MEFKTEELVDIIEGVLIKTRPLFEIQCTCLSFNHRYRMGKPKGHSTKVCKRCKAIRVIEERCSEQIHINLKAEGGGVDGS